MKTTTKLTSQLKDADATLTEIRLVSMKTEK